MIVSWTNNKERRVTFLVGKNIRILREIKEISQKELADKIGVPSGTLSHIERGSRQPSIEMLYNIADALNVSVINFFLDEKEIARFMFDDVIKARFPGSERLNEILNQLIENGIAWNKTRRVAVIDLDDLKLENE